VLRGEVLTKVPIGFIRHHHRNRIEMTPDREVQEAIRGVFGHFERFGTLRQVLLWYHKENITLPHLHVSEGEGAQRTVWCLPTYQQLLRMLKNPTYAGAFAYGRTQCRTVVVEGRSRKSGGHKVEMDNWQLLLKDHHAGYISWEQYLENQRILTANRTKSHAVSPGAVNPKDTTSIQIVAQMDELFGIDAQARQEGLSQIDRHGLRLDKSKPLLEEIKTSIQAARTGALAKACDYTLTLWSRLSRFLEYSELELSNNLAENAMRPVALGRRNWIHVGSKEVGPRVAAIIPMSKLVGE
jgi:Transposase IS66 family/Recombinase